MILINWQRKWRIATKIKNRKKKFFILFLCCKICIILYECIFKKNLNSHNGRNNIISFTLKQVIIFFRIIAISLTLHHYIVAVSKCICVEHSCGITQSSKSFYRVLNQNIIFSWINNGISKQFCHSCFAHIFAVLKQFSWKIKSFFQI